MSKSEYHLNAFLSICNNEYGGKYEDIPKDYCLEYLAASQNPLCINKEMHLSMLKDKSLATVFLFNSMVTSGVEDVFFDYLSKQNVPSLSLFYKDKKELISNLFNDYQVGRITLDHINKFLSLGFEFKQSKRMDGLEFEMLDSGNLKFFQFLKERSEFNFNKGYQDIDGTLISLDKYMTEIKLDKRFPDLYSYIVKMKHMDSLGESLEKNDCEVKTKMKI